MLICVVDAALNVWFVRMVRQRLVRYHGLAKYSALVRFNSYLMVISVCMDVSAISFQFLYPMALVWPACYAALIAVAKEEC